MMTPEDDANVLTGQLPGNVRVGPFDFRIELMAPCRAASEKAFGLCNCLEHVISLQRDMPNKSRVVDTFLHELMHAIYWAYGIEDRDEEERIVGAIAVGMTALFRDNPWLLDWIKGAKL
jgi:hypothetical protein